MDSQSRTSLASSSSSMSDTTEVITLFPGWATKKYANGSPRVNPTGPTPFEVEVFTSGYAISYPNRDTLSRSHRAFIRLAKGFASLPKLVHDAALPHQPTRSTEELLAETGPIHLPPRPDEIDEAFNTAYRSSIPSDDIGTLGQGPSAGPLPGESLVNLTSDAINKLHANLEARLKPFWSSVVSNRKVRLHIFASPHTTDDAHHDLDDETYWEYNKPLASTDVVTTSDGSFQARFTVGWDQLCVHPRALHIAFGQAEPGCEEREHDVVVVAELLEQLPDSEQQNVPYPSYVSPRRASRTSQPATTTTKSQIHIPITHSPIRVISDIDDTIKKSGVLSGARAVFYNVFVKELTECIIPGMGEWYTSMWKRGVRFHYVSNGPFEYVSVLNEYLPLSQLPAGSIKLKSYARRSLFNGLMSTAAGRKRAGVEEVLDSFPDSRFFLIGDSGEQDLELYADLARERPSNILGVFIRDVSTEEGVTDPIEDPTGWNAVVAHATSKTLGMDSEARLATDEDPVVGDPEPPRRIANSRRSVSELLLSVAGRRSSSLSSFLAYTDRDPERLAAESAGESDSDSGMMYPSQRNGSAPIVQGEPEEMRPGDRALINDQIESDTDPTPRMNTVPRMMSTNESVPIITCVDESTPRQYITEAPKAVRPPSLYTRPASSSASTLSTSRRSQRTGDATSSASSASSVSSSHSQFSLSAALQDNGNGGGGGGGADTRKLRHIFKAKVEKMTRTATTSNSVDERRRAELQVRVWRARTLMPSHVVFRVFRHPVECTEVAETLDREFGSSKAAAASA
ncbi:hypothetical protein FA15DRAFT_594632 [Coprinopsis marcescibilis]|uniref:Phosphatidate phosphatase APP1 catalytic domain-containing protein n=1 Tax=Coprinopsis marcescibilis TaxID=230819 RepID=A0A5C3KRF1_COPMA|nr:hypothetical protein FA15DRAFT_594632 [Coprinopsis marcescibilis]